QPRFPPPSPSMAIFRTSKNLQRAKEALHSGPKLLPERNRAMPHPRSVPLILAILLAVTLAGAAPGAPEPAPSGPAATPEALAAAVAGALNARDATALESLVPEPRPEWMASVVEGRGTERAVRRRWDGVAAVLPGDGGADETVAVFSTYHPVESDDDHV